MPPVLLPREAALEAISSPLQPLPRSSALDFIPQSLASLLRRQQSNTAIIAASYGNINSGPQPGTVVGIVLGSVAGFILLLWLFYTCLSGNTWSRDTESEVIVRRDHRRRPRSRRSEKVEIRRESRPVAERVVVEEHIRRSRSASASLSGSDEVVVIEEQSPPRKSKKKSSSRRDSGFRTVDPSSYGGVIGGSRR